MNEPARATLVIAEDNVLVAEALQTLLATEFSVVAVVHDGESAVAAAAKLQPDVLLLDVSLPVVRGFEAARRIRAHHPEMKLLFVSNYAEKAFVQEAFSLGANGYVRKNSSATELISAVSAVLRGDFYQSDF